MSYFLACTTQDLLEQLKSAAELDEDEFQERRSKWFDDFNLAEPRGAPRRPRSDGPVTYRAGVTAGRLRKYSSSFTDAAELAALENAITAAHADDADAERAAVHRSGIEGVEGAGGGHIGGGRDGGSGDASNDIVGRGRFVGINFCDTVIRDNKHAHFVALVSLCFARVPL
eukprot:5201731-Prymnesium_polylepis.1